jgi:phosphoserine phosphatase
VHSIFGNSLVSLPADTPKIVATLFYNPSGPATSDDPAPLDRLYGTHVSQLCITKFLQVMESLSTPYQRMSSSHRCLDREDQPRVVEVTVSPPPNPEYLTFDEMRKHESIWQFEREWSVEVVLQRESVFRRHKRLAVFDMDSTLIQQEVIDEIARDIGVEKEVSV